MKVNLAAENDHIENIDPAGYFNLSFKGIPNEG
jgi:hypothetical protein